MRGWIAGWVFICLLGTALAQAPLQDSDRTRLADGLFSRGMYELALPEYQRLLEAVPKLGNQEVLAFRAAESARELGQTDAAIGYYAQSLKAKSTGFVAARSRYRLAEIALVRKDLHAAGVQLREGLKLDLTPGLEAPMRYLLGQVLESEGKPKEAVQEYRTLIKKFPKDTLIGYASLRLASLGELSKKERRSAYKAALKNAQNPQMQVEVLWGWAQFEQAEGNTEKAAENFWELIKRLPDHPQVKQGLIQIAWAQLNAGEYERAISLFESVSEEEQVLHQEAWDYLEAASLRGLKRDADALKAYEEFVETHPESTFRVYAGFAAASLFAATGAHHKVWEYEEEIRTFPGRKAEGLWLLAESARASGQDSQAIATYTELLKEVPDASMAPDALYQRSVLQRSGEPSKAKAGFIEFVDQYPEDDRRFQALETAGNLAMAGDDLEEAFELWSRALQQEEPPDDLVFRTGMLAVQLDKPTEAQKLLALSEASDMPKAQKGDAAYWRGILFEEAEEAESAATAYELALQMAPDADWASRARLRLGRLYQLEGEEEKALNAFLPLTQGETAAELSDEMLLWLSEIAEGQGRAKDQVTVAKAMQAEARGEIMIEIGHYAEAWALLQLDQQEAAVAAWKKGLALNSGTVEAAEAGIALGETLIKLERAEEALDIFGNAALTAASLEQGRMQANALKGVGLSEMKLERWEAAAKTFLSVSILFDDPVLVPQCLDLAAFAFDRAGRPDQAAAIRAERAERYPPSPSAETTP